MLLLFVSKIMPTKGFLQIKLLTLSAVCFRKATSN